MAYALGSKPSTVGNQLSRALQKLRLAKRSDLVRTWGLLARGDTQVSPLPEVDDALVVARGARASRPLPQLTPAEREIATLLAEGWSNSDIARHRGVSPRTVANQVQRIFDKLGVSSRVAVQNAIERG
ncbi:MAG: response regulator transcription factor [Myxococcales bacterium]|nr:response regulator transcription factor [Myxococcales bacterium]